MAQALGWRFAKLWTASTTSALGSGLATIAAPLFVAAHTRSPLSAATYAASAVLVGLVAGTYRRRRAPAQTAIAERGSNARSGPSLPKGSAGWHTSGCCAR